MTVPPWAPRVGIRLARTTQALPAPALAAEPGQLTAKLDIAADGVRRVARIRRSRGQAGPVSGAPIAGAGQYFCCAKFVPHPCHKGGGPGRHDAHQGGAGVPSDQAFLPKVLVSSLGRADSQAEDPGSLPVVPFSRTPR